MKTKIQSLLQAVVVALMLMPSVTTMAQSYTPTPENLLARNEFQESRFGIFIHWGIYSMFAQGEWYLQNYPIDKY